MAGLEGIDAASMEIVDALQARFVYDEQTRIVRPLVRHADFVPVAVHGAAVRAAKAKGGETAASFGEAADDERVIARVRFGMPGFQGRLITNARDDKLREARSWKALLGKPQHHCLTAVSYVVERAGKDVRPVGGIEPGGTYRIQRRDGRPMVVPGLCAVRHLSFSSTGNEYDDLCHVQITTEADRLVGTIHDRFVVDLADAAARDAWMAADVEACMALLRSAPDEAYEMAPVSGDVWTRRKDPDAVEPVGRPVAWEDVQDKGQRTL